MLRAICYVLGIPYCDHKWKIVDNYKILVGHLDHFVGVQYVLQCDKCGNIKERKVM